MVLYYTTIVCILTDQEIPEPLAHSVETDMLETGLHITALYNDHNRILDYHTMTTNTWSTTTIEQHWLLFIH